MKVYRIVAVALCMSVCLSSAFAANAAEIALEAEAVEAEAELSTEDIPQGTYETFYWRYITPREMGAVDAKAKEQGVAYYFEGLQSGDIYTQYMAINKLVEYWSDKEISEQAIAAIEPFLTNAEPKLAAAAAFSIDILSRTYSDPRIIHLADGSLLFTLFNNYSDYGTYNEIWRIKDGELSKYMSYSAPCMYITDMIASPDNSKVAVVMCSNKSTYVEILDSCNSLVSPELIDSARFQLASEQGWVIWQRTDFENYSGLVTDWAQDENGVWHYADTKSIYWLDDNTLQMHASLSYNFIEWDVEALVTFDMSTKELTVAPIELKIRGR